MGFFRSFRAILERSQGKITFSFLKSPIQNPREVLFVNERRVRLLFLTRVVQTVGKHSLLDYDFHSLMKQRQ
jgi:hypothetical protein